MAPQLERENAQFIKLNRPVKLEPIKKAARKWKKVFQSFWNFLAKMIDILRKD